VVTFIQPDEYKNPPESRGVFLEAFEEKDCEKENFFLVAHHLIRNRQTTHGSSPRAGFSG
jgi:hypothetical protein